MNQSTNKYILYVDDEPQALKYFKKLFGNQFNILTAPSADDAVAIVEADSDRIGVLVTDQKMPGRTGVDLMEQIRMQHPNIVRILTTAYSELDAAIKAVNEGGAFRYLTKPWNEEEMIGTLLRASEYHAALEDRDRLLTEKLSVLHRLVVMDRVRGLATAATALDGRIRGAWPALVQYMSQSPVTKRIQVQMDEIASLNMVALARREAEQMVRTVQMLLEDTVRCSSGDDNAVDVAGLVQQFYDQVHVELSEDDLELSVTGTDARIQVATDAGMFSRLLSILVRRLSDAQEHPSKIAIDLQSDASTVTLRVRGCFEKLPAEQFASFFAAAIPLKKWPIGLDMDLLSSFMIAHHLGGGLEIDAESNDGPSLTVTLPRSPATNASNTIDPDWFDTVYESLEEWQNEMLAIA